jgi:hypothetical protein
MILTHQLKKEQHQRRLNLKTAEKAFCRQIVGGTNCSAYEAEIIVDRAKQHFGIGEYAEERKLLDGQMVFIAVSEKAPPGMPMEECPKVRVVLTHLRRIDDQEVSNTHGASAKRQQQLMRMCEEAREQGALLSQEDLGLILDCDVRTIRRDIRHLHGRGIAVPTRGTVRDIGPCVSHKRKAVELWLQGREAAEVAWAMHHSLNSVERYIQTFCRVVYAQRMLRNSLKTALVVGISVPAMHTYWDLHQELVGKNEYHRYRMEEVLGIGKRHWEAVDGKKSLLPSQKSQEKRTKP